MIITSFHIITLYFIRTNPMFYSSDDFFSNIYLSFTPNVCIFLAFFSCLCFCWDSRPALNRRPENSESDTGTPAKEPQSNRSDIPKKDNKETKTDGKGTAEGCICVCVWCVSVYTQIKKASKINNNINTSEGKSRHRERERERVPKKSERRR